MNATGSGAARTEDEVREELGRLFPAPGEREVPPGPRLRHRDRLMRLIDEDQARGTRSTRPVRRPVRPSLWLPATAAALALALGVTLLSTQGSDPDLRGGDTAVVLLDRIADVAAKTEQPAVRDDQFVYVKSLTAGAEAFEDGPYVPGKLHEREEWMSQEPGPVKQLGLIYEDGYYSPLRELLPPGSPGVPAGLLRPTYQWLASLPTDPDELLKELYRLTKPVEGEEKDQAVFDKIGQLVQGTVMPPRTAAALYAAAAKIPGVTRIEDAVDAAGRHGVGIARVDKRASWATEWVFDRENLTFLGRRSYLTQDTQMGRKGLVLDESAVLERAIVDEYRQRPGTR